MDAITKGALLLHRRISFLSSNVFAQAVTAHVVYGLVFAAVLSPLFFSPLLFGSTLQDETLDSAAADAVWIGRIHIESSRTLSNAESQFPVSQIEARVVEVLKGGGNSGQKLSFEVPGGSDGRLTRRILGFPQFKESQDYIVFLDRDPRDNALALSLRGAQVSTWSAYRVIDQEGRAMVVRAGESTLRNQTDRGYRLVHDRGIKSYESFVDDLYRSLN